MTECPRARCAQATGKTYGKPVLPPAAPGRLSQWGKALLSPYAGNSSNAWNVNFNNGNVNTNNKNNAFRVRLVRGGES